MPLETIEVGQVTESAPEETEEEQYHADIARLEAELQAARDRFAQAETAMWTQAEHYATVQALEAAGGFRLARYEQPTHWSQTPKREHAALAQRIEARARALADIEGRHAAIRARQVQWGETRWEAAFLATPEAQFITHQLEETLAALDVAKATKQEDMLGVLARRRDSLKKQLDAARSELRQRQFAEMQRQASLAMAEADRRARQKRGV